MMIPNYFNSKMIDRDGYLTPEWQGFFQQLIQALQMNLSDEGYRLPQQSSTTIAQLEALFAASSTPRAYFGDMIYDTTTNQFKVNINGTFKVVTVV